MGRINVFVDKFLMAVSEIPSSVLYPSSCCFVAELETKSRSFYHRQLHLCQRERHVCILWISWEGAWRSGSHLHVADFEGGSGRCVARVL